MGVPQDRLSICNVNPIRLLYFALATSNCVVAAESRETFDRSTELPEGWQSGITGQGRAKWEIIPEQSAPTKPNVLRQSGEATFAWAAKMDAVIKDGFVEVRSTRSAVTKTKPAESSGASRTQTIITSFARTH